MAEVVLHVVVEKGQLDALKAEIASLGNQKINLDFSSVNSGTSAIKNMTSAQAALALQQEKTRTQTEKSNTAWMLSLTQEARATANMKELEVQQERTTTASKNLAIQQERTNTQFAKTNTILAQTKLQEEKTATAAQRLAIEQEKTARAAERQSNKPDILGSFLGNLATEAVSRAISFTTEKVKEGIKVTQDVDAQLTNIRKVTGMTAESAEQLGQRAYKTATKYAIPVQDLLAATYDMQKAGLGDSAEAMAELAVKTQLVGDTTQETASKFLVSANAAFKLDGNYERLSEVIDEADYINNNFATDLGKLAQGFPIVASTAANAGMSIEETMAAIGTITATTQETGSKASTALRALIMNIAGEVGSFVDESGEKIEVTKEGVESITDALRIYGSESIKTAIQTGKVIDPMEAITSLAKAYKDDLLTDIELQQILFKVGGKTRANQLTALVQDIASDNSIYKQMMEGMKNSAGTADAEIDIMTESINAKKEQLGNAWAGLMETIFPRDSQAGFLDSLTTVFSDFNTLLNDGFFGMRQSQADRFEDDLSSVQAKIRGVEQDIKDAQAAGADGFFVDSLKSDLKSLRDEEKELLGIKRSYDDYLPEKAASELTGSRGLFGSKESLAQETKHLLDLAEAGKIVDENGERVGAQLDENAAKVRVYTEALEEQKEAQGKLSAEEEAALKTGRDLVDRYDRIQEGIESGKKALEDFRNGTSKALDTAEVDSYSDAFQKVLDGLKEGATDSEQYKKALETFMDPSTLQAFGGDYEAAGQALASDFWKGVFSGSDTADQAEIFANSLLDMADAAGKVFDKNGELAASFETLGDETRITSYNTEALAKMFNVSESVIDNMIQGVFGLDERLDITDSGIMKMAESYDALGKSAKGLTQIDVGKFIEGLAGEDYTADNIEQIVGALKQLESVELTNLPDNLGAAIKNAMEGVSEAVEEVSTEAPEVEITADGSQAEAEIESVKGSAESLSGTEAEVKVTADASDVTAEVGAAKGETESYNGTEAEGTLTVDISGVESGVSAAIGLVESFNGMSAEATLTTRYVEVHETGSSFGSRGGFSGGSSFGSRSGFSGGSSGTSTASGARSAPSSSGGRKMPARAGGGLTEGGDTLLNEEAPEIIQYGDEAWIAGGGEPTIQRLPRGARIFNAKETKEILARRGADWRIRAAASGTTKVLSGGYFKRRDSSTYSGNSSSSGSASSSSGTGSTYVGSVTNNYDVANAYLGADLSGQTLQSIAAGSAYDLTLGSTNAGKSGSKDKDPELERLENVVALRKQELALMKERGDAEADQQAKIKEIQAALHDQAEYLRQSNADWQENVEIQTDLAGLQQEWYSYYNDLNDAALDKLADQVTLRESELSLMEARGASEEEQIEKLREIQNAQHEQAEAIRQTKAYLEGDVDALKEVNSLSESWMDKQAQINALQKEIEQRLVKQASDRLQLLGDELDYQEASGASQEAQIDLMRKIQDTLHEKAEALRQTSEYLEGDVDTLSEVNDLSVQWWQYQNKILEIEKEIGEALEKEILDRQKEIADRFKDLASFQNQALNLLETFGADSEILVLKMGDIQDALLNQLEYMKATGAEMTDMLSVAEDYIDIENEKLQLQQKIASGEKTLGIAERNELDFLKSVVSLRESERDLMKARGDDTDAQVDKLRQLQDAIKAEGEYMKSIGVSQEEINRLAADWYQVEADILDLQNQVNDSLDKARDIELQYLEDVVKLRESELSLMEARGESTDDLIRKNRELQDAIRAQGKYMQEIGASQEEINDLATDWWNIQKKILRLQQDEFDRLKEEADEYIDKMEDEAVSALEEQLELLKKQHEKLQDSREEEEKLLAVAKARAAFENAQRERTVRTYNAASGQWEWVANAQDVAKAEEELADTYNELAEYYVEKQYKAAVALLELQIEYTEAAFETLRDSLDYVAKKIKAGEMTYKEAYDYVAAKMKGCYDEYEVKLSAAMEDAKDSMFYAMEGASDSLSEAARNVKESIDFGALLVDGGFAGLQNIMDRASSDLDGTLFHLSSIMDGASVDLTHVMNEAMGRLENVSGEIWNTNAAFQTVKGQVNDTVAGFGSISSQLDRTTDALETAENQLNIAALTFGSVNTDLRRAEGALSSSADLLANLPPIIQDLLNGLMDTAGQGMYAGTNIPEEDQYDARQAVIDEMQQNSVDWWTESDAGRQTLADRNLELGTNLGWTRDNAGVWHDETGGTAYNVDMAAVEKNVIEQMKANSAKWLAVSSESYRQTLADENLRLGTQMGWYRGKDGYWYRDAALTQRVYDRGGLLRGRGSIKATDRDELVLRPEVTEAIKAADGAGRMEKAQEAIHSFAEMAQLLPGSLDTVTDAFANRFPGAVFGGGSRPGQKGLFSGNGAQTVYNGPVIYVDGMQIREMQQTDTIGELVRRAKSLSLCTNR